ncbi:hypothetical protein DPMN_092591 [Dreissena polymorpha]|uniref:Uncharacterized protein n=1 Tax=Dreissena polymorpha TaxID=45954 RepID=A0A9D4R1U6_DREPO|nr:hypothetical protein DPMN_092591 [Dreissena polymorpha]
MAVTWQHGEYTTGYHFHLRELVLPPSLQRNHVIHQLLVDITLQLIQQDTLLPIEVQNIQLLED